MKNKQEMVEYLQEFIISRQKDIKWQEQTIVDCIERYTRMNIIDDDYAKNTLKSAKELLNMYKEDVKNHKSFLEAIESGSLKSL